MRPIDADALTEKIKKVRHGYCTEDKENIRLLNYVLQWLCAMVNREPTISDQDRWIPVTEKYPEVDAEGYSAYILLSFDNCSALCIGQYREDEKGGAFYDRDEDDPLIKVGLVVNAWMPMPEAYSPLGDK